MLSRHPALSQLNGAGCLTHPAPSHPLLGGGRDTSKPPAFQFYAKDWLSSPTRLRMSRAERGLFLDMIAFAWDSDEPGTIDMPVQSFAKLLGISSKVLRKFLAKFPKTFVKVTSKKFKLSQPKLTEQWISLCALSDIRKKAAMARYANAEHKDQSASSSAFASSSASSNPHLSPSAAVGEEGKNGQPTAPAPSREMTLAFRALGHQPFGTADFQRIWLESYQAAGEDPNWTDIMEGAIQRCKSLRVQIPGLFYKHKHEIENGQTKMRYQVAAS